jgi:hypothetical protein
MRAPLRPRFPDRSSCHGRDLTTRVRSARRIRRCHVCRYHDPGPWQAALARSRTRRPTIHPVHRSSDNGSEKAAGKRHPLSGRAGCGRRQLSRRPGSWRLLGLVDSKDIFSAEGPWSSAARCEYRPNASSSPGLPLAGAVYASTGPTIGRELEAKVYSAATRSFRPSSFRISSSSSSVVITRPKNISIVLREAWCIPSSNEALQSLGKAT